VPRQAVVSSVCPPPAGRTGWARHNGGGGARFSAPVQTSPGAHSASYTMGIGSFPGVKQPGRGVNHSPPSSAEVKERVELYLYSPSGSSWPVLGWTLPLPSPTRRQNLALGRRCSATTVLCYPVVTPFKQVAMPFNYANAVTGRRHAFAVPLAVFVAKPVRPWQLSCKCPLRGQQLTCSFFGYAHSGQ